MAIAQPGELIPEVYVDFSNLRGETVPLPSVLCNCWAYTKSVYPSLPSTKVILSNLEESGNVAVFYYSEVGLHHYAVVRSETDTHYLIEETNYKSCAHGVREIRKDDPALLGFFPI